MVSSLQFLAKMNIKMTQNKLFETYEWDVKKIKKLQLRRKMASTMHLDEFDV